MISTAHFLTVEDVFYQRLHQTADLLDVIRHRALLDAQLVRHFLLGGSVIEQTEDPAVLRFDFCQHGDKVFQKSTVGHLHSERSLYHCVQGLMHPIVLMAISDY